MKKYKFRLKKVIEDTVEIQAENDKKAIFELIELIISENENVFKNTKESDIGYDIILEEVEEKNEENASKNIQEFLKDYKEFKKNFKKENEEIEDDLPKEYTEIICEKCGETIFIDEDFMS